MSPNHGPRSHRLLLHGGEAGQGVGLGRLVVGIEQSRQLANPALHQCPALCCRGRHRGRLLQAVLSLVTPTGDFFTPTRQVLENVGGHRTDPLYAGKPGA